MREGQTQQRLLEASVWPFLQYESNDIPAIIQKIDFSLQNAGVGPAAMHHCPPAEAPLFQG